MRYAKWRCPECQGVNLFEEAALFEMIEKAGFTLCTVCSAPGRFEQRKPDSHEQWQKAPVVLTAQQLLFVPHQVLLWMKTRAQGIERDKRTLLRQTQQGGAVPSRALITG